ncbi:hypothetical protein PGT21_001021, partial [Puccinia graminis f. sp. tritici]
MSSPLSVVTNPGPQPNESDAPESLGTMIAAACSEIPNANGTVSSQLGLTEGSPR